MAPAVPTPTTGEEASQLLDVGQLVSQAAGAWRRSTWAAMSSLLVACLLFVVAMTAQPWAPVLRGTAVPLRDVIGLSKAGGQRGSALKWYALVGQAPGLDDGIGSARGGDPQARAQSDSNVVFHWNDVFLFQAMQAGMGPTGPTVFSRALAVLNTCIFDAWAPFDAAAKGTHSNLKKVPSAKNLTNVRDIAIAWAAYTAASDLFPDARTRNTFAQELEVAVFGFATWPPRSTPTDWDLDELSMFAAEIGTRACEHVLHVRHRDGANQLGDHPSCNGTAPYGDYTGYRPVNLPGQPVTDPTRWQPLVINGQAQEFLTPQWGRVLPFAFPKNGWEEHVINPVREGIRKLGGTPGPVRDASDPAFRQQVEEVLTYAQGLTDLTKAKAEFFNVLDWTSPDETSIWFEPFENLPAFWAMLALGTARTRGFDVRTNVQLFYGLSNTLLDTSIAVWGAKVKYDSVRPITAVRHLFQDVPVVSWNGEVPGRDWTPYQSSNFVTPPHAEYPSGRGALSSAAAEYLRLFLGSAVLDVEPEEAILIPQGSSWVEPGLVPADSIWLSWPLLTDAADDAAESCRWAGTHFVQGDMDSRAYGRKVAQLVWEKARDHFGGTCVPHFAGGASRPSPA